MSRPGRWKAKLIARLLATAALWVRIQTSIKNSLKNTKWPTQASPRNKNKKKIEQRSCDGGLGGGGCMGRAHGRVARQKYTSNAYTIIGYFMWALW